MIWCGRPKWGQHMSGMGSYVATPLCPVHPYARTSSAQAVTFEKCQIRTLGIYSAETSVGH
jgi:hypothetical protein